MPTHRQVMVEVPVTTRGFGNSGSAGVSSCFPTSPIGPNGDYNADDDIKALAQQLLLDGVVSRCPISQALLALEGFLGWSPHSLSSCDVHSSLPQVRQT